LTPSQHRAVRTAVEKFVADLGSGRFRRGLRVKAIQGAPGIFEMTWAANGRATFEYGEEAQPGQPHVIWRRIGAHDIFARP
jgi:hypothetical protein